MLKIIIIEKQNAFFIIFKWLYIGKHWITLRINIPSQGMMLVISHSIFLGSDIMDIGYEYGCGYSYDSHLDTI